MSNDTLDLLLTFMSNLLFVTGAAVWLLALAGWATGCVKVKFFNEED